VAERVEGGGKRNSRLQLQAAISQAKAIGWATDYFPRACWTIFKLAQERDKFRVRIVDRP
jgi:hypothetical protein